MLEHVLASLAAAGIEQPVVVVGHGAEQLEALLAGRVTTVRQEAQKGTADAVRAGLAEVAEGTRQVVVAMGDAPLVPAALFEELLRAQSAGDACVALLVSRPSDPTGYGRIVRGADGGVRAIVEESRCRSPDPSAWRGERRRLLLRWRMAAGEHRRRAGLGSRASTT